MSGKLTEQQLNQLKPIINKFVQLLEDIDNGDIKRAPRHIKDFSTKCKFPSFSPPFIDAVNAAYAYKKDDFETANILARKISSTKTTEGNICNLLIRIFKSCNDVDHLLEVYQRLIDDNPKETDPLYWDLPAQLAIQNFAKAQERAMKIVQLAKNDLKEKENAIVFAGTCSYYRAKVDRPLFYKLALSLFDKTSCKNPNIAEIRINCLLNQDPNNKENIQNALNYLKSSEVQELLSYNELQRARLEIQIQTALGNMAAVGEKAAEILNTINADSIGEWKLAVKNYPDIENLIQKHINGKLRGPQLALIELALHRKEDPSKYILDYATKYAQKPYLLGDISPYLTPDVLQKLKDVNDPALQCLINDKFDDAKIQVTNEATANMKAQELVRKGDRASLYQAVNILEPYQTEGTSRVLLLRIAGLLNLAVAQNHLWKDQRLEAIQYLSLLSLYLKDIISAWDIDDLAQMVKSTCSFCEKGISSYMSHLNAALHDYNFLIIETSTKFISSIKANIGFYIMRVLRDWIEILKDPKAITPYKLEKYLPLKDLQEKLEERIDESVFPLYYKKDTKENAALKDKLFPSIKNLAFNINAAVRVIFALKLDQANVKACLDELNSVANGSQWMVLANFVQKDCKEIDFKAGGEAPLDALLLGSLAIVANICNAPKEIKDKIAEETNKAAANLKDLMKLDELPELFKKYNEEQDKNICNAKELILNLLK